MILAISLTIKKYSKNLKILSEKKIFTINIISQIEYIIQFYCWDFLKLFS